MNDWERAKSLLKSGSNSCVIIKDEDVLISQKKGIAPLVDLLQRKKDLSGGKSVVTVFPDDLKKYLSTDLSKYIDNNKELLSNKIELLGLEVVS